MKEFARAIDARLAWFPKDVMVLSLLPTRPYRLAAWSTSHHELPLPTPITANNDSLQFDTARSVQIILLQSFIVLSQPNSGAWKQTLG